MQLKAVKPNQWIISAINTAQRLTAHQIYYLHNIIAALMSRNDGETPPGSADRGRSNERGMYKNIR